MCSVSFDDVPALEDLSFEVAAGETRIILGAAGSGKTVLLKTALGLVSGRIPVPCIYSGRTLRA